MTAEARRQSAAKNLMWCSDQSNPNLQSFPKSQQDQGQSNLRMGSGWFDGFQEGKYCNKKGMLCGNAKGRAWIEYGVYWGDQSRISGRI